MGAPAGKLISGRHVDAPVALLTSPDIYPPFWWQSDIYLTFLVTPWYLSQDIFGIYKSLKIKPIRHPIVSDRISSQNEITCIGEILFTCPAHWLNESVTLLNLETEMFLKLSDYASQIGSAEHFLQKDKKTRNEWV